MDKQLYEEYLKSGFNGTYPDWVKAQNKIMRFILGKLKKAEKTRLPFS